MTAQEAKKIGCYVTGNGRAPFLDWVNELSIKSQVIVDRFIQRVAQGGARKSTRNLKDGVFEIKIPYGPGLRVYFGKDRDTLILLLTDRSKGTQNKDIKKDKEYWRNYDQQK